MGTNNFLQQKRHIISTIYRTNYMPHISKQPIEKDYFETLFKELEKLIATTTLKDSAAVLHALLTETEKIMLTKRLAAALLFAKNYSQYQVWNLLKISPSTAQKMYLAFESGHYDSLITILNKKQYSDIWNMLELVLQAGMPSLGKDRWKSLR